MKHLVLVVLMAMSLFGFLSCKDGEEAESKKVYATIDGKVIRGKEINSSIQHELWQLKVKAFDLRRQALEEEITKFVLEKEARKQKVRVSDLFNEANRAADEPVSEEEADEFLKKNVKDPTKITAELRAQAPRLVKRQRVMDARRDYVRKLIGAAKIKVNLSPPDIERLNIDRKKAVQRGGKNPVVVIDFFADYLNSSTPPVATVLSQIEGRYGEQVGLAFHHLPSGDVFSNSFSTHLASACASEQGLFWKFYDYVVGSFNEVFPSDKPFSVESLYGAVGKIGIDGMALEKFKGCMTSDRLKQELSGQAKKASNYGVRSGPAVFVNGARIVGNLSPENFVEIVEAELKETQKKKAK